MFKEFVLSIWIQKCDLCVSCSRLCIKHRKKHIKILNVNYSKSNSLIFLKLCQLVCSVMYIMPPFPVFQELPDLQDFLGKLDFKKLIIYHFYKYRNCQNSITWNFDSSTTYDVKMRSIERSWTYFFREFMKGCVSLRLEMEYISKLVSSTLTVLRIFLPMFRFVDILVIFNFSRWCFNIQGSLWYEVLTMWYRGKKVCKKWVIAG